MSFKDLSNDERQNLQLIFEDLKKLFAKEDIPVSEIDDFVSTLQSSEVKSYITNLRKGAKPETALREAFFAGQSILSRYMSTEMNPEINTGDGFIDYKMFSGTRYVMLELKPLFEAETRESKGGRELIKLKQKRLKWETHKSQILKYIKKGGEFIVITDLRDWYFFDDTATKENCQPFFHSDFHDLEKEFAMVENFYRLIERYKYQSLSEDLDKVFFEDLKLWVKKILEVEFDVDEKKKVQVVLGIINKFIFIQTLDDYSVVEFRWIQKTWQYAEERWGSRSRLEVLRQFFDDTIKWFFKFYDTELFLNNEIELLKDDKKNVDKFYTNIKSVLGLTYLESDIGGQRGIMQYKFRFIDEDIFGKAYETFLGEVRHDEGIYYTPKYITQYIVENTVSKLFDSTTTEIKNCLKKEDFEGAAKNISSLTKIKVLDPACGSGSFLIKATREIWKRYTEIVTVIEEQLKEIDVYDTLSRSSKIDERVMKIRHLRDLLGFKSNRELISRLLLRHIHGNDLDPRAVAVTKVNLWLEAVKLSPRDFRYDKLPSDTNRILPYLEMNIVNGDAVVGLPDQQVIDYLATNHKEELSNLSKLRDTYLNNPIDPELVDKIEEQKKKLRIELMNQFSKQLKKDGISDSVVTITIPLFWPLEFWYMYFDDSTPLPEELWGVDCVVSNPPYVRIEVLNEKSPDYVKYLNNADFDSSVKQYDLAAVFTEKGYKLLRKNGRFGYIVSNKFIQTTFGEGIRSFLSKNKAVEQLIDFGDQQVFEDASTYTSLLFLSKSQNTKMHYVLVKKLEHTREQLMKMNSSVKGTNNFSSVNVEVSSLTANPWIFSSVDDKLITQKFENLPKLSDITDRIFEGIHTSADRVYICQLLEDGPKLVKVHSFSTDNDYTIEKELTRPLLKGKDIKRWMAEDTDLITIFPYTIIEGKAHLIEESVFSKNYPKIWEYFLENKNLLEQRDRGAWKGRTDWYAYGRRQNLEQFDQEKIMTQVLAKRSTLALDLGQNMYFVGGGNAGGYGITIKKKEVSLQYLCGLLNSILLEWAIKKSSTRFRGGYYSYGKRFIEKLPIVIPDKTNEQITNQIENLVKTIIANKRELSQFYDIWSYWSYQMKDAEYSLMDILRSEEENIKEGDLKYTWFEKVSFFVSKKNEILTKEFDYFEIHGNYDKSSIQVFGVTENEEEPLFEFVLKNNTLVDHFYLSLKTTSESRAKINTLEQLFEKTKISVLQPNPSQKTPNIMPKVFEEFSKVSSNKIDSFVKTENEAEDAEAKIDALVFQLYNLTKDEMNSILNSVGLPNSYQIKVNNYFLT